MHSILHQHKNLKLDATSNQASQSQSTTTLAFHKQPIDNIIGGFPFLSSITNADVMGVVASILPQAEVHGKRRPQLLKWCMGPNERYLATNAHTVELSPVWSVPAAKADNDSNVQHAV